MDVDNAIVMECGGLKELVNWQDLQIFFTLIFSFKVSKSFPESWQMNDFPSKAKVHLWKKVGSSTLFLSLKK